MNEREYYKSLSEVIKAKRIDISLDKEDALRILDTLIARGLVIMGVGKGYGTELIDLFNQIKFKENQNFSDVVKFLSLRCKFVTLVSLFKSKKSPEARKLIELFEAGYTMWDILKNEDLTKTFLLKEYL